MPALRFRSPEVHGRCGAGLTVVNDADVEVQKARVLGLVQGWKHQMGLADWHITIKWYREPKGVATDSEYGCILDIETLWQYKSAEIRAYLPTVADLSDDRLDWAVAHEFAHLLTEEMARPEKGRRRQEHVATQLAWAFVWIRNSATERGNAQGRLDALASMKTKTASPLAADPV